MKTDRHSTLLRNSLDWLVQAKELDNVAVKLLPTAALDINPRKDRGWPARIRAIAIGAGPLLLLLVGLLVWLTKKRRRKWVVDAVKKAKKPSPKKVVEKKESVEDEPDSLDENRDKESDADSSKDLASTGKDGASDTEPSSEKDTVENVDDKSEATNEALNDSGTLPTDGEDKLLRDTDENPTVPTQEEP